jgi:extradiol dioxygenase family protein
VVPALWRRAGLRGGRSTATWWILADFFGHQLSLHLAAPFKTASTGHVGEYLVSRIFMLALPDWQALAGALWYGEARRSALPQVRFSALKLASSGRCFLRPVATDA